MSTKQLLEFALMFHAAQCIILPLKKGQLALQFPIVDHTPLIQSGALDRTAWFGGVGAIPKSAVPRQKLNIVKAGVKLIGISPEVQLAQAGAGPSATSLLASGTAPGAWLCGAHAGRFCAPDMCVAVLQPVTHSAG